MYKAVIEAGHRELIPVDLVEFHSQGRVLVIGTEAQIQSVLPYLEALQVHTAVQAPESVTGWLGNFSVKTGEQSFKVDCVLDLLPDPVIQRPVLPLGYFAPRDDAQALAEALVQLPQLKGIFDKPRYFEFDATICAHSRRQVPGCNQCLDACPAQAIDSAGDAVKVNPYLCQGCGSCTAVCPSGAIRYALPTLDVSIERLRSMLKTYYTLATCPPRIVIHDRDKGQTILASMGECLPHEIIPFSIEEIGALGMPFYLAALAMGAGSITVWDAGSHLDHAWTEIQTEIKKTNQLLAGLGYGTHLIDWFQGHRFEALKHHLKQTERMPTIKPATFAGLDDKRRMITLALSHLHQQAPQPVAMLSLPHHAAFGEVQVDPEACTLCLSCVAVCPVGALLDGKDQPQLDFIEDRCVQCGLCERACPEQAILLNPRYLFDRQQARQRRRLHEAPIFHCICCHKPFATQKMIETMTQKLKQHPMFQGEALERLKMCEDCRIKAMFASQTGA